MPEYDTLLVTKDDGVAWVSLNRPEVRNAFNLRMQSELRDLWRVFRYDDDVRCVVLSGEGDAFCTGIDRAEAMSDEARETDFFSGIRHRGCTTIPGEMSVPSRTTSGSR